MCGVEKPVEVTVDSMYRTQEDIHALIKRGETFHLECKKAQGGLPGSLWETYSAFCNTDGGIILLGVKESEEAGFEVVGVEDEASLIKGFWDAIHNREKVSACVLSEGDVRVISCDGKKVIAIDVPRVESRARPVYVGTNAFDGSYRRNGEGDYKCSPDAVESMIRDRCADPADSCVMERLTAEDLNADTIRRYRLRFSRCKPTSTWNELADAEFLRCIGALSKDEKGVLRPTLAGLVCFGDFITIATCAPNYFVDYREKLMGETRWNDRVCAHDGTWSGNIYDFFFQIHDKIVADVRKSFVLAKDGVTRIDETKVHESIREVLANALIHADYHGRCGIVVERHFREIAFENPGCFRMSREDAVSGGRSDARNPIIFNIFSLVEIGERSGHGLSNVFETWKKAKFPSPSISESYDPDRTMVTLKFDAEVLPQSGVVESGQKLGQKPGQKSGQKIDLEDASAATRMVYKAICDDVRFTHRGLAAKLGLSASTVDTAISTLVKRGILRRIGPKKGGRWEIVESS